MTDLVYDHAGPHSFVVVRGKDVLPYGHFVAGGKAVGVDAPLAGRRGTDAEETLSGRGMEPSQTVWYNSGECWNLVCPQQWKFSTQVGCRKQALGRL